MGGCAFVALRMNSGTFGVRHNLDQVSILWLPVAPLGWGSGHCSSFRHPLPHLFMNSSLPTFFLCLLLSRQVSLPEDGQQVHCCHCWNYCSTFASVCLHLQIYYKAKSSRANGKTSWWLTSGRHFPLSLESLLSGPGPYVSVPIPMGSDNTICCNRPCCTWMHKLLTWGILVCN